MNKKGVNKMKKQLEKFNNVSSIILACLLAVGIGALGRSALESASDLSSSGESSFLET